MSLTQQPDPVSAASDSQTELSKRKVRPKSVTAPTTRSQSQKDSTTEDVFGSQTLQRTAGKPDLRDDLPSGLSDQITQGRDNYPTDDFFIELPGPSQHLAEQPLSFFRFQTVLELATPCLLPLLERPQPGFMLLLSFSETPLSLLHFS